MPVCAGLCFLGGLHLRDDFHTASQSGFFVVVKRCFDFTDGWMNDGVLFPLFGFWVFCNYESTYILFFPSLPSIANMNDFKFSLPISHLVAELVPATSSIAISSFTTSPMLVSPEDVSCRDEARPSAMD
jgi:hypothetical protein